MTVEQVLAAVDKQATQLVELTGGEPLLQKAARPLLHALCERDKTVLLETSGERDIANIDPRVHRIMDIKTPSSGQCEKNRWQNLQLLTHKDEIKMVIGDREDYQWACQVIEREKLTSRVGEVLLSPVHGRLDPEELSAWILQDDLRVRLQLQLHKYIFGADAKNV